MLLLYQQFNLKIKQKVQTITAGKVFAYNIVKNINLKLLTMKSKFLLLAFTLMLVVTTTLNATPATKKALAEKVMAMTAEQKEARIAEMKQRVQIIKAMDRSQLSRAERKALREELRNMNKEAKAISNAGIYLSLGAIIVIVVLLLLLL